MRALMVVVAILVSLSVISVQVESQTSKVFVIGMHYDEGSVSASEVTLRSGEWSQEFGGDYSYDILSSDGRTLHSSSFRIPNYRIVENSSAVFLEKVNFTVTAPYFPDAVEIRVSGPEGDTSLNVSEFSGLVIEEEPAQPEAETVPEQVPVQEKVAEKPRDDTSVYVIVAVVGVIALALVFYVLSIRKGSRDPYEKLKSKWPGFG